MFLPLSLSEPATTVNPPNTVPLGEAKWIGIGVGGGGGTVFGGPVLGGFTVLEKELYTGLSRT